MELVEFYDTEKRKSIMLNLAHIISFEQIPGADEVINVNTTIGPIQLKVKYEDLKKACIISKEG